MRSGLSIGWAGLVLDLTRTQITSIGWRGEGTRNRLPEKSVELVSGEGERRSGRVGCQNKKGHRNLKKSVTGIWKISSETGKTCQKLENLVENWKNSPEFLRNLHFSLKIAWIFLDLAKSY